MSAQRILSYSMSKKLSIEDLNAISAAGSTSVATEEMTFTSRGATDLSIDISADL